MYVVYENPVPMVCDTPSAYRGQPGFEFLKEVPTVWDETRFLAGDVGEYIAVARRKGKQWYVGCMTGSKGREINIPLSFLGKGDYRAKILADDAEHADDPNRVRTSQRKVTANDSLTVKMLPDGGQAIRLVPAAASEPTASCDAEQAASDRPQTPRDGCSPSDPS
jgi:alpha-glucosidase